MTYTKHPITNFHVDSAIHICKILASSLDGLTIEELSHRTDRSINTLKVELPSLIDHEFVKQSNERFFVTEKGLIIGNASKEELPKKFLECVSDQPVFSLVRDIMQKNKNIESENLGVMLDEELMRRGVKRKEWSDATRIRKAQLYLSWLNFISENQAKLTRQIDEISDLTISREQFIKRLGRLEMLLDLKYPSRDEIMSEINDFLETSIRSDSKRLSASLKSLKKQTDFLISKNMLSEPYLELIRSRIEEIGEILGL